MIWKKGVKRYDVRCRGESGNFPGTKCESLAQGDLGEPWMTKTGPCVVQPGAGRSDGCNCSTAQKPLATAVSAGPQPRN